MRGRGPDGTRFTREAYMMAIRMLADNYKYVQIQRAIHDKFPEHREGEELEVTYRMVWSLAKTRRDEVMELREALSRELTDLWMANKRQRIVALQEIYEDCNRWVPKRIIEPPRTSKLRDDDEEQGVPTPVLVFEKDVGSMLAALKQAREEMGETAGDKMAQSFQDLVRLAEEQRGLEHTAELAAHPKDAVDYIEDAQVLEIAPPSRSKGADLKRGFLDGDDPAIDENATRLLESQVRE